MKFRASILRTALMFLFALLAASCSSGDLGSDTAVESEPENSEVVAPGETEAAEEVVDTATEGVTETSLEAQESVTASTVHDASTDEFPDIIAVQATPTGNNTWRFDVTVSSTYDTPERYADAWRVVGPDGAEYGIRVLTHDHAGEQPFTRSQSGIEIPAEVTRVTVEGRDLANGWGGGTLEIELS